MATRDKSHSVEVERQYEARSTESFDRIAYAIQLLALLNPPLKVAVYRNSRQLLVERGRALGTEAAWALFGVPPHATRESIVRALAELSGLANTPFLVDLLSAKTAQPLAS